MAKKRYYAVKVGRTPGIYATWAEAQKQITGYPNAVFKGFATEAEALADKDVDIILTHEEAQRIADQLFPWL